MPEVRAAAVAGRFYPDEAPLLRGSVQRHLLEGRGSEGGGPPKALIAPHAGYVYSGPIAGSAYRTLLPLRGRISRVVLLGPAHHVAVRGLAVPSVQAFETPLGRVPLDRDAIDRLVAMAEVVVSDEAHRLEHSLEVQLPFLQEALGEFELVPLVVGDATGGDVAAVLERLWGGDETLIVVSSDLSHDHDYETARRMDAATSRAIEAVRPESIDWDDACGRIPIQGLLLAARAHGLEPETIDLRSSGDTAGPRDGGVVGYGAYQLRRRPGSPSRQRITSAAIAAPRAL